MEKQYGADTRKRTKNEAGNCRRKRYFHLAGTGGKPPRFPWFVGRLSSCAKRQPSRSWCKARLCVSLRGISRNTKSTPGKATLQPACAHRNWSPADFSGTLKSDRSSAGLCCSFPASSSDGHPRRPRHRAQNHGGRAPTARAELLPPLSSLPWVRGRAQEHPSPTRGCCTVAFGPYAVLRWNKSVFVQ